MMCLTKRELTHKEQGRSINERRMMMIDRLARFGLIDVRNAVRPETKSDKGLCPQGCMSCSNVISNHVSIIRCLISVGSACISCRREQWTWTVAIDQVCAGLSSFAWLKMDRDCSQHVCVDHASTNTDRVVPESTAQKRYMRGRWCPVPWMRCDFHGWFRDVPAPSSRESRRDILLWSSWPCPSTACRRDMAQLQNECMIDG